MRFLNTRWGHSFREEAGDGDGGGAAGGDGGTGDGGGSDIPVTMDAIFGAVGDEGLRTEAMKTFTETSPEAFIKTALNAQKMIGNSFRIPSDDAGEEDWNKFYSKLSGVKGVVVNADNDLLRKSLGVPEKADEYKVDLSALPEDIQIDQSELDAKREYWHSLGLTQEQVDNEAKKWVESEVNDLNEWKAEFENCQKALKAEYGAAFDEKMQLSNFVLQNVLSQDDATFLKATGAMSRPGIVKALVEMGEQLKDDGSIEAARAKQGAYTPSEAKARIGEINANPAYWDSTHPEHKALVAKMQELYKYANAG